MPRIGIDNMASDWGIDMYVCSESFIHFICVLELVFFFFPLSLHAKVLFFFLFPSCNIVL